MIHDPPAPPRLRLVALERHHLPLRVAYLNDPEVQAALSFETPVSLARTEAWFSRTLSTSDRVDFALETAEGRIAGFGGLIHHDRAARKAELYIFIGARELRGRGLGRAGYRLLANHGFVELGLERLYLYQLTSNERALRATAALGFVSEGILRRDCWSHGTLKDRMILSLLREEWATNPAFQAETAHA